MTATPHNGKEEDFQLFLSLLDSDRFYGKFRDGVHKVDASDLMRRMVKEELVKFDGTPLFPERRAYTVNYKLSDIEAALYEAVTHYVQDGNGQGRRSSRARAKARSASRSPPSSAASPPVPRPSSSRSSAARSGSKAACARKSCWHRGQQILAETLGDAARRRRRPQRRGAGEPRGNAHRRGHGRQDHRRTRSRDRHSRRASNKQAKAVVASGQDRKWDELSKILQNNPEMHDAAGRQRKLIIFSEHRDTLNYLQQKIAGVLGNADAIVTIHGGTHRDERRKRPGPVPLRPRRPRPRRHRCRRRRRQPPERQPDGQLRPALEPEPAGTALRPHPPHRPDEVCHLWNLVAKETREGDVYHRLLKKLEVESEALKGRVFDILGEVFEETSLKDLLLEAIRYGDQPEVRARLTQQIDHAFDHDHLKALLDRNALAQETMSADRLFAVKEEMEKAEARRLQPYFVRSFFLKAFDALGGAMHPREAGPLRDHPRPGRHPRARPPHHRPQPPRTRASPEALRAHLLHQGSRPAARQAGHSHRRLMHPGHPLMLAVSDIVLEQHATCCARAPSWSTRPTRATKPSLLFLLTHEIKSGDGTVLSKRLQFVRVAPDGKATFAGWAPHLDLEPLADRRPRRC